MTRRHRFDEAQADAAQKDDKAFVTKNNPAVSVYAGASITLTLCRDLCMLTSRTVVQNRFCTSTWRKRKLTALLMARDGQS